MKTIDKLSYKIVVQYKTSTNTPITVSKSMDDLGYETNSIQIGDVCVTDKTIQGRVLSGTLNSSGTVCGYIYNYSKNNDEYLTCINPNIPIDIATSLINKTKMTEDFIKARMVLISIMRQDNNIYALPSNTAKVTKTVSAIDEHNQQHVYKEQISLTKHKGTDTFVEKRKVRTYKVGKKSVTENHTLTNTTTSTLKADDTIKNEVLALLDICNSNPQNYRELLHSKKSIPSIDTPAF